MAKINNENEKVYSQEKYKGMNIDQDEDTDEEEIN